MAKSCDDWRRIGQKAIFFPVDMANPEKSSADFDVPAGDSHKTTFFGRGIGGHDRRPFPAGIWNSSIFRLTILSFHGFDLVIHVTNVHQRIPASKLDQAA